MIRYLVTLASCALLAAPIFAQQPKVTAGEFRVERPTLVSLGFEWRIAGDDNRNAHVEVRYRVKGAGQWREGLPLLRLGGEQVLGGRPRNGDPHFYDYVAPTMFAGSILNLAPDTEYEARFTLADPDGAGGKIEQSVTVRTRAAPLTPTGGRTYHVYPYGFAGPKIEPAFTGLMAAYYRGSDQSDHSVAMPPRVRPGDVILVHAGIYKDDRFAYGGFDPAFGGYGTPFDGTYYLTQSGTAERPITIKAAGDGEVVFDGDGNHNLFNLLAANYNHFEGITVRNTDIAFLLGWKNIGGASGFSLRRARIENFGRGVQDEWAGSKDFYIADNVFVGRHDPSKLVGWWPADMWKNVPGGPARLLSDYAVKIYGQGHVVAYNRVANVHDGIDVATYGTPSDDPALVPVAIDIYGNDISNIDDNCIEADGSAHNVRVFENRCFNVATGGISTQPIFGGPAYIYRNIVYNGLVGGALKFVDTPAGILVYQNTFVGQGRLFGPVSNTHFRNNLFLGDGWNDTLFNFSTFTNYSSSDYNGFRPNPGAKASFEWTSPAFGTASDFKGSPVFGGATDYRGELVQRRYASLAAFSAATGQDRHSRLLDYDALVRVMPPDRKDLQRLYDPANFDFRPRPGGAAIDSGVILPSITDGFTGHAPDLGAYEAGRPVLDYGPRNQTR
jgi:hypothetical protein